MDVKNIRQSHGRYSADDLILFSNELLQYAGLTNDRASVVAEALLEGDLMGHATHGLELLPRYLEAGTMTNQGDPPVRLPGERALRLRADQVQRGVSLYPTIIPAIRRWAEKFSIPLPTPIA